MSIDVAEKNLFETWYRASEPSLTENAFAHNGTRYEFSSIQGAWEGWKAAREYEEKHSWVDVNQRMPTVGKGQVLTVDSKGNVMMCYVVKGHDGKVYFDIDYELLSDGTFLTTGGSTIRYWKPAPKFTGVL